MLSDEEIAKLLKSAHGATLPEWKLTYMKRIAKNLQVHTKGLLFSKVDTLFPHEHPDSKAHCVNTYEPITKGSVWKALNNIVRIFSNSSFAVSASDSTLLKISENIFGGQNLFSWFVEKWNTMAIGTDPNALCAIYPPAYIEDYPGDIVRFISNEHIKQISSEMVVFISETDSDKTYTLVENVLKSETFYDANIQGINARTVIEKTYNQELVCKIEKSIYHVFTREHFISFSEENGKFTYEAYAFDHALSEIPAFMVSSPTIQLDVKESFVSSFIPFGNLALLQHRNHRAVDLMFSYPRMSEIETPCDNFNCNEGMVHDLSDPTKQVSCSRCKGSGYITVQSPYKVYKKRIDTGLSDPDIVKNLIAAEPVTFHTPDVSILDYSKNSWKDYLSMAEEAVFIQQKQETGNTESAKAKQIDKEGEYSWIMNISKALNADLKRVIEAIEGYIEVNPAIVSIEQPISFAMVTETEAFEALDAIISSEAPIFVKAQQVENFIHKFVSKSSPVVKALKILKLVDPLLFYATKDVQSFKSNNVISVDAWAVHVFAYPVMMQLYEADKLLFEKTDEVITKLITTKIEEFKPKPGMLKDALLGKVA